MLQNLLTLMVVTAAHAQPAPTHSLDAAIRSLSKTALELDSAQAQSADDKDAQKAIAQLKEKASGLWTEAVLVPVKTSDNALHNLGYDIVLLNPNPQYNLVKNQKYQDLQKSAFALNAAPWQTLYQTAGRQIEAVRAIGALAGDSAYTDGISSGARQAVATGAGSDRLNHLRMLQQISDAQVKCVNYFSGAYTNYGLKPEGSGDSVHWSADDLARVYGVRDITKISAAQKTTIRGALEALMKNLNQFDAVCVSDDVAYFLEKEHTAVEK